MQLATCLRIVSQAWSSLTRTARRSGPARSRTARSMAGGSSKSSVGAGPARWRRPSTWRQRAVRVATSVSNSARPAPSAAVRTMQSQSRPAWRSTSAASAASRSRSASVDTRRETRTRGGAGAASTGVSGWASGLGGRTTRCRPANAALTVSRGPLPCRPPRPWRESLTTWTSTRSPGRYRAMSRSKDAPSVAWPMSTNAASMAGARRAMRPR